jgi:hypothetical protein
MAEATTKKTNNIYTALVEFQKDIPIITKDSTADTGKYSYDYASLDKITPLVFEKLSALDVVYTTAPTVREDGTFVLRAKLIHAPSETEIAADYPLGNPNAPAQGIGSAVTYARRYALLAMTGIAPTGDDDDGAKASAETAKAAARPEPVKDSAQSVRDEMGALVNKPDENKVTGDDANAIMEEIAPGKSPAQWTLTELKKGRDKLIALSNERKAAS